MTWFSISEGSEDEIEVTSDHFEENSMEKGVMVPPHVDTTDYTTNNNVPESATTGHILQETTTNNSKLSVKTPDELFDKSPASELFAETKQYINSLNGKFDLMYLRARSMVLASNVLPTELELRDFGIFARVNVTKGTRYGPFQGKWAGAPDDLRFAWEVRRKLTNLYRFFK